MANPWFRLYSEFANDAKVQMMSESMQRRYIMLMCLRCSNALRNGDSNNMTSLRDEEVAFLLRISEDEIAETKELFIKKGFIDSEWNLLNWDKRQRRSDIDVSGAERQRKYREKQEEIKRNALRNGTVTLPDTDTDTEVTTLSGKPDGDQPEKPKKPNETEQAKEALDYLNAKTGKNYQSVDANIKPLKARIKETDLATVKAVIDRKVADWQYDEKMQEFLRPATLFNATKFASYAGDAGGNSIPAWER